MSENNNGNGNHTNGVNIRTPNGISYTPECVSEMTQQVKDEVRRQEEIAELGRSDAAQQARAEVARRVEAEPPKRDTDWGRRMDKMAADLRALQRTQRAERESKRGITYPRKRENTWPPYMAHHHFKLEAADILVPWMTDATITTRARLIDGLSCSRCKNEGEIRTQLQDKEGYFHMVPCSCAPWRKVIDEFDRAGLPGSACGHLLENMNWGLIEARRMIQRTMGDPTWAPVDVQDEARRVSLGGDHDGARRHGALFFGHSGTAKSHIIQGLIIEAILAGKRARWAHWPHLLRRMKATFNKYAPETVESVFSWATNTDVLAIEEIGGEKITDWAREQLEAMLTKCEDNGITVLISTNVDGHRLVKEIGGAAVSRIKGLCEIIEMRGRDYRAMSVDERRL